MAMFSFDKSSYEFRLLDLLQARFFKVAKRNKILAKWAAGRLGLQGAEASSYVRKMIFSYIMIPIDRKLVEKILSDFAVSKIPVTEDTIWKKIKAIEVRIDNKAKADEEND